MGPQAKKDSYIKGLDGLRALAVLLVFFYHMTPQFMRGGFIGVDLFYVISGFLITYLLIRSRDRYATSAKDYITNFWLRRFRRLLPACTLLIVICVPLAALIEPDLLVGIGRQVIGALTFSFNWLEILHGSSYFEMGMPQLFKNFWSLALEIQFYIVWPLLLVLAMRAHVRPTQARNISLALALISSLLMALMFNPENPTRVYYGTDTHFMGLALGAAVAFDYTSKRSQIRRISSRLSKRTREILPWVFVGIYLVLAATLEDSQPASYPAAFMAASVVGACLVASVCLMGPGHAQSFFENRVIAGLGIRSYGVYLWHWPLLVLGRVLIKTPPRSIEHICVDLASFALTLCIAELSYRYLEEPVRKLGFKCALQTYVQSARNHLLRVFRIALPSLLACACVLSIVFAPHTTRLQAQIEANVESDIVNASEATEIQEQEHPASSDSNEGTIPDYDETQSRGVPSGKTITAVGDSLISGVAVGFQTTYPDISILAKPIRQWGDARPVIEAGLDAGLIKQNVILDFGTNGGVPDEAMVRDVLDLLGDKRRIILYTLYAPSDFIDEANACYERLAEEYPNVHIARWAEMAQAHPDYVGPDQTHVNIDGMYPFVDCATQAFAAS